LTASNTADLFYQLFNTFTFLAVIVGGIVLGLMAYLIVRFRGRDGFPEPADAPTLGHIPPARGHLKTVAISVTLSAIVLGVLIFGTLNATEVITTVPSECRPLQSSPYGSAHCAYIQVTAFRFGWNFTYLNTILEGQTLTGNLTIPFATNVILQIRSMDTGGRQGVFHAFGVDDFKIKKDAIPGLTNTLWFRATDLDPHTIRCFEFCGIGHSGMTGKVNVVQPGSLGCSSTGC